MATDFRAGFATISPFSPQPDPPEDRSRPNNQRPWPDKPDGRRYSQPTVNPFPTNSNTNKPDVIKTIKTANGDASAWPYPAGPKSR
jgi:hypothetical protein